MTERTAAKIVVGAVLVLLIVPAILTGPQPAGAAQGWQPPSTLGSPSRVNIGYAGSIPADIYSRVANAGGAILKTQANLKLVIAKNTTVNQTTFIANMRAYGDTRYIGPDGNVWLQYTPNDPMYATSQKGYLDKIGMSGAWDMTLGSRSVTIGIVDTGVDCLHEDFQVSLTQSICNPLSPGQVDAIGHGTFIAGIAGAVINNNLGIAGTSQSTIFSASLDPGAGEGLFLGEGAIGIILATTAGAKVISLSWEMCALVSDNPETTVCATCTPDPTTGLPGGPEWAAMCAPVQDAISFANSNGAIVFVAAGNTGGDNADCHFYQKWPANFSQVLPNVVPVASYYNATDTISTFSACGVGQGVTAPGENINSTAPGPNVNLCRFPVNVSYYCEASGTSFAAPHVAGVAALMLARCPNLTNADVKDILLNNTATATVRVLPNVPQTRQGKGLIQADQDLLAATRHQHCQA